MIQELPNTLFDAEELMHKSICQAFNSTDNRLMSVYLLFQNLRLNPVVFRLTDYLISKKIGIYILCPDEGSTALAKRDFPSLVSSIFSYSSLLKNLPNINLSNLLIAISPQPYEFDQFKQVCDKYKGRILMFNGKLEDTAIGIGNVGRERRRDFIFSWNKIFWLQPLKTGAIMKLYGDKWQLFKLDVDGYRFKNSFDKKPDEDIIIESLNQNT